MAAGSFIDRVRRGIRAFRAPYKAAVPARFAQRQYAAARGGRLAADWTTPISSADSEIASSLRQLIARSRAACRDIPYAKRTKQLIVNNVIGAKIGMQAQVKNTRGELNKRVNDEIEELHEECARAEFFHTGGRLSADDFDRALMDQVVEAGGVLVRDHFTAFGGSRVRFAQELIEIERLADDVVAPFLAPNSENEIRMGIEVDRFHRPVAYYIRKRHPGEYRFNAWDPDSIERVPAEQITHLALIDRWPQTRGVPWFHAVLTNMKDMAGYVEAEITRARVQACSVGAIETEEGAGSFGEEQDDGTVEMEVEPGVYKRLDPGEKLVAHPANSPNPTAEPFLRFLLREWSAGTGPSYESISRDYSQSNYSSSRLGKLDDRDLWQVLQAWFIRSYRAPRHRKWLRQAVLGGVLKSVTVEQYALDTAKFERVRFRPRGWGWVDPTKEVAAFKDAVRSGFMTLQDVVATSGADIEELMEQRKKETEAAEKAGLIFDTDPKQVSNAGLTQARPLGTTLPVDSDEAAAAAAEAKKDDWAEPSPQRPD